jgi:hypothetical protein
MKKLMILILLAACAKTGPQGANGTDGKDGKNGTNPPQLRISESPADPSVCPSGGTEVSFNYVLQLGQTAPEVPSPITVCNGLAGVSAPLGIQEAIAPCGAASSSFKEVLLRLADGSLLASFSANSSGQNTRLSLLPDGSYTDTDDSACSFTVSTNGNTRSISWSGGGESWTIQ